MPCKFDHAASNEHSSLQSLATFTSRGYHPASRAAAQAPCSPSQVQHADHIDRNQQPYRTLKTDEWMPDRGMQQDSARAGFQESLMGPVSGRRPQEPQHMKPTAERSAKPRKAPKVPRKASEKQNKAMRSAAGLLLRDLI